MIPKQKKFHKFLLYYRLFLEVVLGGHTETLNTNDDLNNKTNYLKYRSPNGTITSTIGNIPSSVTGGFMMEVLPSSQTSFVIQKLYEYNKPGIYIRQLITGGAWTNWYKCEGSVVA